jgi:hypothetical protein
MRFPRVLSGMYKPDPNKPHFRLRFIAQDNFISDAIKVVSRAPRASHVEIITPNGYLGAHAQGGIQERPENYCTPVWERRYALPCTPEQAEGILAEGHEHIGEKYDFIDCLGLLTQHDMHTKGRAQCAEFVFGLAFKHGIMMLNVDPARDFLVTPEMLHTSNLLIGHCYFVEGN